MEGAQKYAVGGMTAAALFEALKPNYALAMEVQPDDQRIKGEEVTIPSPQGNGTIKGYLVRPANAQKLPVVLVVHENRGLNPYIRDVARRLAVNGFMALAPDGLTSVGGYPGDDEKGAAFSVRSMAARCARTSRRGNRAARPTAPASWRRGLLLRRHRQSIGGAHGLGYGGCFVLWGSTQRRDTAKIKAPINAQYGELDERITGGWKAFDATLTANHVPHEGHVYKGANHGFHNDTTPRYDQAAAKEAWQHTLDWFNKYLKA